jgi:thioredoxin 1
MTIDINTVEQFQEIIRNGVSLVDFHAEWCGPCRQLGPVLENFGRTNANKIKVLKVDVDNDNIQKIVTDFAVRGIPALFWFKDGMLVYKQTGFTSEHNLQTITDQILA